MVTKGVDSTLYNALVNVTANAVRLQAKVEDNLTDALRAVVGTSDIDLFDRTYDMFVENMRKRNEPVPMAVQALRDVVREAAAKGVPIADGNGVPRPFAELREAAAAPVRKKRRGRPPRQSQH